MGLDPVAEAAEHALEDHNEQMDEMALFGRNADATINIDVVEPTSTMAETMIGSSSRTSTCSGSTTRDTRTRKRLPTSRVWAVFDEVTGVHDKGKKVIVSTICKHYKSTLTARSSSGIGQLLRHCGGQISPGSTRRLEGLAKDSRPIIPQGHPFVGQGRNH
jgi:hypothetical protein